MPSDDKRVDGNLRVFTVGHLMPREGEGAAPMPQPGLSSVPPLQNLPEGMPSLDKTQQERRRTSGDERAPTSNGQPSAAPAADAPTTPNGRPILRVRRGTYIPGWAVPPRVLLVEDDAVCRTLSSKFLQVFGCAIDVAVDGVTAVNKMNLEKYDLVLMDIGKHIFAFLGLRRR